MRGKNSESSSVGARIDGFAGIFLGVFLALVALVAVRAATVTALVDRMSMARSSAPANHEISFITANGAADGQVLSIIWPAGFDASAMTEDDVDLIDDGAKLTTAADCSGVEQASAGWAGNTLTFTICPGDGGAIAAGSAVRIAVGTNATGSGVGANMIVNPAAVGSYQIVVSGTSGNSGAAAVAIISADTLDVTARVEAHNPPGGGGAPSVMPRPQVSGFVIDQITTSTARASWRTDIISNSYVLFGLTGSYGAVRGSDELVLEHSVLLAGLAPGYIYHAQARSVDQFGVVGVSTDQTFSTLKGESPIPPQITNIRIESVTAYETVILWETDKPAYSRVEFGRTANYGNVVETPQFSVEHRAVLGNLSPQAQYHYRIIAIDESGNQTFSNDETFNTFDTVLPVISNIRVENIAAHSFDIAWNTDKPATGGVKYGMSLSYESGETIEPMGFATSHRVILRGLASAATYHFKIFQSDQNGNDAESDDQTAVTASDLVAPANPQAFSAVPGDKSVTLSWKNPVESDLGGVIIRRKTGGYPNSTSDGALVYEGSNTEKIDTGLNNGTEYYYKIFGIDKSGNASTGSLARVVPSKTPDAKPAPIVPDEAPMGSEVFGASRLVYAIDGVPASLYVGALRVFLASRIRIELPNDLTTKAIKNAYLRMRSDTYELAANANGILYTDIIAPALSGDTTVIAYIEYKDGRSAYSKWSITTVPASVVYETLNNERVPVSDAKIEIYENGDLWDGAKFGRSNPQFTDENGAFRAIVPKGVYDIVVSKTNYRQLVNKNQALNGVVEQSFQLKKILGLSVPVQETSRFFETAIGNILNLVKNNLVTTFSLLVAILTFLFIIKRFVKRK